jgi:flavin-binding protein dodecin
LRVVVAQVHGKEQAAQVARAAVVQAQETQSALDHLQVIQQQRQLVQAAAVDLTVQLVDQVQADL